MQELKFVLPVNWHNSQRFINSRLFFTIEIYHCFIYRTIGLNSATETANLKVESGVRFHLIVLLRKQLQVPD